MSPFPFSFRPAEQYLITPHIVESDGGGKGNLLVCDTHGPFKPISVLSKQVTADHMNMQILYPEQMPKRSKINKMETEFATNTFPEGILYYFLCSGAGYNLIYCAERETEIS